MCSAVALTTLKSQLDRVSECELLTRLASNESGLLTSIELSRCVLVSYRQEPGPAPFDSLTMDGGALHGILAAAAQLGAVGVWLDAWCYRQAGPVYVHEDFCRMLDSILSGVSGVVWLPRSTRTSLGEYGYRLWCTFEASNVHQRRLPVAIAGVGLSRFQQRVHVWGSFIPALRADGTLDQLARLNLSVYFFAFAQISFSVVAWATEFVDAQAFGVHLCLTAWCVPLWLASRASLGQQVRLGKNAKTVLGVMTAAAGRGAARRMAPEATGSDSAGAYGRPPSLRSWNPPLVPRARTRLLQELAWLPAYDRRDVLVVQSLLACLPGGAPLGVDGIRALALSAHTAARMRPSAGDSTATTSSLRAWLAERNIETVLVSSEGGEAARATWLDGAGDVARHDDDCLPLPELVRLGWAFPQGAALTPLGALELRMPRGANQGATQGAIQGATRWALAPARGLARPQIVLGTVGFLASNGLEDVASSLLMLLQHRGVISPATNEVVDAVMYFVQWPFVALLLWECLHDRGRSILARRIPVPLVVWPTRDGNAAIMSMALMLALATLYLFVHALGDWELSRDVAQGNPSHTSVAKALNDLSEVIVYGVLTVIFYFEFLLVAIAIVRGVSTARDVAE